MKLPISCHKCFLENTDGLGSVANVEFRDDSRYEFTCSEGHKSITILQEQKFEVLFEIGAFAIKDGYYREAVSSFSSSLEKFYEFVILVILLKQDLDINIIHKSWKLVSNQSERQLGAFIFIYLKEFNDIPTLLSSSNVTFRNSVIHKGRIPSKEEALKYGEAVLDICRPIIRNLNKEYKDQVMKAVVSHIIECRKDNDKDEPVSTLCMPTILSLSVAQPGHDQQTLLNAISQLRKR